MQREHSEMAIADVPEESEWRSGWKVVLAATVGCSAGVFYLGGIMTLVKPLNEVFGWSRAEVMASLLITTVIMLFTAPVVGGIIDRFGARRVALTGMVVCLLVTSAVGLTGPSIWTWYLIWAVSACSASLTLPMVWTIGVAEHFTRNQGKAVGITLCGSGLATALSIPLAYAVYAHFGWRAVFPVLALSSFAVAFPLAWFFFRDPQPGEGRSDRSGAKHPVGEGQPGIRLSEAAWMPRLWLLTVAMFLVGAAMNGLLNHLPSMLTDEGVSAAEAAGLVAIVGPCSILGRLITGFLFDFVNARLVGTIATAFPLVSVFILSQHLTSYEALLPAVIMIGLVSSADAQVTAYLIPKYFGYRNYGKIFGLVFGFMLVGMGFGPFLGGLIFDRTGSYDQMILIVAVALTLGVGMIAALGRYPKSWA
jgi:predicted MFS family arabinose efflux permease